MRILYKITNLINGHAYIGQTKNYEKRMTAHRTCGSKPSPVYYAIQKHGIENFKFEKLAMLEDWMIDEAETKAIEVYKTRKPNGYNLEIGGCKTKQHHPDTIKKISENRKGRVAWNKGKKMSEDHCKKLSKASALKGKPAWNRGLKMSEECCKKLSESHMGNVPPNKGKKMSEEACRKMSEAHIGKIPWNKGLVGKQIAWNKGKRMAKTTDNNKSFDKIRS